MPEPAVIDDADEGRCRHMTEGIAECLCDECECLTSNDCFKRVCDCCGSNWTPNLSCWCAICMSW